MVLRRQRHTMPTKKSHEKSKTKCIYVEQYGIGNKQTIQAYAMAQIDWEFEKRNDEKPARTMYIGREGAGEYEILSSD